MLPELQFRGTYWLALRREHARLARIRAVEVLMQEIVAGRQDDLLGPIRGPLPPG